MSKMSKCNRELDELGYGKCSVPMFLQGIPAGFCNREAFGIRPRSKTYRNSTDRIDGRYSGYVPGLACSEHGGPTSRVFKDGSAWCAVFKDFIDLQESPAGFGDTPEEARNQLKLTSLKNEV